MLENEPNWIRASKLDQMSNSELYLTGVYVTITFILTVGYGDICVANYQEKLLASLMMLVGVMTYSFLQGQFVSLITSYDEACGDYFYQINLLSEMQERYNVGHDLFYAMVRSLKYSRVRKSQRFMNFITELPYKLQIELEKEMHKKLYEQVPFFKNKELAFINWIGLLLRPKQHYDSEYITTEGKEVSESNCPLTIIPII